MQTFTSFFTDSTQLSFTNSFGWCLDKNINRTDNLECSVFCAFEYPAADGTVSGTPHLCGCSAPCECSGDSKICAAMLQKAGGYRSTDIWEFISKWVATFLVVKLSAASNCDLSALFQFIYRQGDSRSSISDISYKFRKMNCFSPSPPKERIISPQPSFSHTPISFF